MAELIPAGTEKQNLRFLLIEDNPTDVELLEYELRRSGFEFTLAVVQTAGEFARELRATRPHLVMADYNLPSWRGLEALEIIAHEGQDVPLILVTGALADTTAVDCIKQGATDYVLKGALARLPVAIRRALQEKNVREQRQQAEENLARSKRALEKGREDQLRFKDELLSHVSHELRTPLTAIKQFSTILLDGSAGKLNDDQHKYQQIVLKNILQLQAMIDDLLEVTRLDNGKLMIQPESVSVPEILTDAINTVYESAYAKGVTLSCNPSPGVPAAYADPTRLRQILLILIDNALRFTPSGGAIRIRARPSEEDSKFVLFEVSDTGCGITAEHVNRIFERLYQVRPVQSSRGGLGLGLFICRGLVTRQGGQIWVESELNKGSTFSFTLPIFAVTNLIAPLLTNNLWPTTMVALVVVEVWPRKLGTTKQAGEWADEARRRIRGCLRPDLDVLLRQTESEAERQRFLVAAFVDEKNSSVLTSRIRGELGLSPLLEQTHLSISQTVLKPIQPEPDAPMEHVVSSMAAHLEAAIKSQTHSEANSDE